MQSHPKKALNSLAWMYSKHVLAGLSGDSKLAIDVKVSINPLTGDLMNGWMDGWITYPSNALGYASYNQIL